jgi:Uma2 family endonuclease
MDYLVRSALLKIKDYLNSAGCPEFLIYKPRWFLFPYHPRELT